MGFFDPLRGRSGGERAPSRRFPLDSAIRGREDLWCALRWPWVRIRDPPRKALKNSVKRNLEVFSARLPRVRDGHGWRISKLGETKQSPPRPRRSSAFRSGTWPSGSWPNNDEAAVAAFPHKLPGLGGELPVLRRSCAFCCRAAQPISPGRHFLVQYALGRARSALTIRLHCSRDRRWAHLR